MGGPGNGVSGYRRGDEGKMIEKWQGGRVGECWEWGIRIEEG